MKGKNKKIALYGGSFDPPHYGHMFGVWALHYSNLFDEVWILPSGDRVDKPSATSSMLRLEMLDILINENFSTENKVFIKDIQISNREVPKTSYELYRHLSDNNQDVEFYLAIGAELVSELSSWKDYTELCQNCSFVIIPRLGIEPDLSLLSKYKILSLPKELDFNISSSIIRKLVSDNKSVLGIVPKSILKFIKDKNLYSG